MNSIQESGRPQTSVESETKSLSLTILNREKSLGKTLGSLVENEKFPDITFSVESKHVPAHRFMLAARSPVFEAMLFGPNYKNEKLIPIEDISYDAFKCMLQYIYTSNPSISEQNVIELMYVAHKYDLPYWEAECEQFIEKKLCVENAVIYYDAFFPIDAFHSLKQKLLDFILKNFYEKFTSPTALAPIRHVDTLKDLLERFANIQSPIDDGGLEYDLFKMIIEWGRRKCDESNSEASAENIRSELKEAHKLIKFNKMDCNSFKMCLKLCPGLFSEQEIGHTFERTEEWLDENKGFGRRFDARMVPGILQRIEDLEKKMAEKGELSKVLDKNYKEFKEMRDYLDLQGYYRR